jgi:hypothetical protein
MNLEGWRAREETAVTAPSHRRVQASLVWRLERMRLMLLQHLMIKESSHQRRSRNPPVTSPRFTP